MISKITVRDGTILHDRLPVRVLRDPVAKHFVFDAHSRWEWHGWIIRDPSCAARNQGAPKFFFVVLRGRETGIFYRWCDAFASVAGFAEPKMRGFDSEAAATRAMQAGHFDDC